MQLKTVLAISLLSVVQSVSATPPPCLLAAVNTQPVPDDFKTICGDHASDVQQHIRFVCKGDDATAALSSFADTCKNNGVAVSPIAPPSTSLPTSSPGSGSGADNPTHTTTGASSVSGTDAAGPDPYTSAYNLTSLFAGNLPGSATATGPGSQTMSMGTGTMPGMSMPTASASGTKTGAANATAAGSAKPTTTSGVAGRFAGSIGGLAVVAAGAVFML